MVSPVTICGGCGSAVSGRAGSLDDMRVKVAARDRKTVVITP